MARLDTGALGSLIRRALKEDIGPGDITTRSLFPKPVRAEARIRVNRETVIAGLPVAKAVFKQMDRGLRFIPLVKEGDPVKPEGVVARIRGDGRSILSGERVALNFLQRLSGIATLTAQFVDAVKGTKVQILDTRKTTPGLRALEKYAVRIGGGKNHRMSLNDGILVKDNHIALTGSLEEAVRRLKGRRKIEVEATCLEEVEAALESKAGIILLDNMTPAQVKEAVERIQGRARTEASGGIRLDNILEIALTGVDFISIGALTHSAPAADMSLEIASLGETG